MQPRTVTSHNEIDPAAFKLLGMDSFNHSRAMHAARLVLAFLATLAFYFWSVKAP